MIVIPLLISFTFNTDISEIGWCRGAKALHDCGLHVGAINIIVIVIERSVATIKVDNYETKKTPILGIFMVNFQWLFSLIFVWFNQVNAQTATYSVHLTYCQREYVSKVLSIFLVIVFFCDLLAMMIFFLLLHINKRRYSHSNPQFELDYALSKRYQISENIQTTRLLYPLIMAYLIGSVIGVILLYFGGQVLRNLKENNLPITLNVYLESSNWGQSFDILFALLAILCPHLAIHGHHSLLREFKRILMFKKDPIISRQPRTINGNKLIMTMSEERQLHFQNLENMWNNSDIEKTPRRSC
uniref:G-protein coupled receptors family 1 profile domain-containing protein n=1 Tax=Panagrolaimus sp. JU765 TaxID=591449 RepID=A0AC34QIB0_9BILA